MKLEKNLRNPLNLVIWELWPGYIPRYECAEPHFIVNTKLQCSLCNSNTVSKFPQKFIFSFPTYTPMQYICMQHMFPLKRTGSANIITDPMTAKGWCHHYIFTQVLCIMKKYLGKNLKTHLSYIVAHTFSQKTMLGNWQHVFPW